MSDILTKLGIVRSSTGESLDCKELFASSRTILLYFWKPGCSHCEHWTTHFRTMLPELKAKKDNIIAISGQSNDLPSFYNGDSRKAESLLDEFDVWAFPTMIAIDPVYPHQIIPKLCLNYGNNPYNKS